MIKKIGIILFLLLSAQYGGRPQGAAPTGLAFAATQENGQPCPPECVTDSMEIITYYPSPYGYYEELRGDKIIVGDTDNSRIDETHLPPSGTITFEPLLDDPDASDGNLYEGSLYYQGAIGGTKGKFRFYDGIDWQDLGGAGGDYWQPSTANTDDIYYNTGNVGIGVGASEAINTKLQINIDVASKKGLVIRNAPLRAPTKISSTRTFNFTGNKEEFTIPRGITKITITAYGAGGEGCGSGNGGKGGLAEATFMVTPGTILYLFVGQEGGGGGWNGGGSGAYRGGGASDVRIGGELLSHRILVAGGGGARSDFSANGGKGGGYSGDGGETSASGTEGGGGGTSYEGGAGGAGIGSNPSGTKGSLGQGGTGGSGGGGGGGGGYYGGGGGGGGSGGAGGGGGSSYIDSRGIDISTQSGVNTGGHGIITIGLWESESNPLIEWQDNSGKVLSSVDYQGRFGIGTANPSAALDIAAGETTIADAWTTRSSLRFKENLYPIDSALTKLTSLRGVYFDYKDSHKRSLGLVAEDVGQVFPELVTYEPNGQDAISLDYDKLGAVTIEAIKEQQREIEQLKEANRSQQKAIELLMAEKEIRE